MKILKEIESDLYSVVMLGGSIGNEPIHSLNQLKGKDIFDDDSLFDDINKAKEKAKRMNGILSPGEKKYYGLKYVVALVKDNKYTGK